MVVGADRLPPADHPPDRGRLDGGLDDGGPKALVQIPEPVSRFPEFVGYLVRRLKALCPAMGRVRIARGLARAGLHSRFDHGPPEAARTAATEA
jgi:hypothetical protein